MAFRGQVAFVTGGASGMGRLSSIRLAEQGAKVFAVDMDEAGLAEIDQQFSNITTMKVDVSDYEQVKEAISKASTDLGPIDRLTHAAAIMPLGSIKDMPVEIFVKQMRINYEGTVYLVKSVLPSMLERDHGDIISFGSIAGEAPLPKAGGYCATKAATNAFMRQVILEHSKSKLRILLVCPPPVNTPLLNAEKTGMRAMSGKQIQRSLKSGVMVEPEFILDQIEKSLEKTSKKVLFPGYFAKAVVNAYKVSPNQVGKLLANMSI